MSMSKFKYPTRAGLSGKQKRQVKGIINSQKDMKQFFTPILQVPVSGTAVITELSLVTKGDDFDERAEDTVQALSLRLSLSVINAGTPARQTFRILLVRAKTSPLTIADVPAYNAIPNYERMQVYYDKFIAIDNVDLTAPCFLEKKVNFKKKLIPYMKIGWVEATSTTVAQKNGLYLMSSTNEATNGPSIYGGALLKFYNEI